MKLTTKKQGQPLETGKNRVWFVRDLRISDLFGTGSGFDYYVLTALKIPGEAVGEILRNARLSIDFKVYSIGVTKEEIERCGIYSYEEREKLEFGPYDAVIMPCGDEFIFVQANAVGVRKRPGGDGRIVIPVE